METALEKGRNPNHQITPLIAKRWSSRAMSGETISDEELFSLFEAARFAPSCFNNQPWRFLYAKRETPAWEQLREIQVEFNRSWTEKSGALILILSRNLFERNDKPAQTHSFDTGAAWMNLALQGCEMNLVVHAMQGFDYEKSRKVFSIPEVYTIEAMVAVGKPAPLSTLSEELQAKENLSTRKEIAEFVSEGKFSSDWK